MSKNPVLIGADEYAARLDWTLHKCFDPAKLPYEVADQTGGEAFDGLKALLQSGGGGTSSLTANYWLMFEGTRIARRKK